MYVLDSREVEFDLEKLNNCHLWDAYEVLRCRKKILTTNERAYLIFGDSRNIFRRSFFYLQIVKLPPNICLDDEVFLVENVVEAFCNDISKINEQDWWLCAALNQSRSDLRIIAGIGKGILLSRFLPPNSNGSQEVFKTITYLQRFGLGKHIKIFSSLDVKINETVDYEKISFEKLPEEFRFHGLKSISRSSNYWEKYLSNEVFYPVLLVLSLALLAICYHIEDQRQLVESLKNNVRVVTKNMELEINGKNFSITKQFTDLLRESFLPLQLLKKAHDLCKKHNISIEQLSLEKNQIKIKTLLDNTLVNDLKSSCHLEQIFQEEYEELESNKKRVVVLCIK